MKGGHGISNHILPFTGEGNLSLQREIQPEILFTQKITANEENGNTRFCIRPIIYYICRT